MCDTKEKVDHPCDSCHSVGISRPAQDFCADCAEAMCEHCSEVHQKQKISRNHVIISMKEFTTNPQTVIELAKGFSCTEHDGESIDFYCKDHRKACCGKCCIVTHRNCSHVSDLMKELPSLHRKENTDTIINQMKILETHLKMFKEFNESNISLLESQVNGIIAEIRVLRKELNDAFDELERKLKMEGNIIYKAELMDKQEENDRCQSLINSIRNAHTLLETTQIYGTKKQVFLMTEKMTSQLRSQLDEIQKEYTNTETTVLMLDVNPHVQSILSACPDSLAKLISRKELRIMPVPGLVQMDRMIEIEGNYYSSDYTSVTYLYSGHVMLADYKNKRVYLLNSSYNPVSSYKLPSFPYCVCVVDDNVAVSLPWKNTIHFLSVRHGRIRSTREIITRYRCDGVATDGKRKMVLSGHCNDGGKHYWGLISVGGKEESCHQFDCHCKPSPTYIALDSSFTRVYITVRLAHSVYCFDMSGSQKFVYNHELLESPTGVATDIYNNVYVIGYDSNNIHRLTATGDVLQIISDGVPDKPQAICFNRDCNEILVTNWSHNTTLYQYRLK